MSVLYRVGDKVRVLSRDELIKKCGKPNRDGDIYDDEHRDYFWSTLFNCCNSVATINDIDDITGELRLDIRDKRGGHAWIYPWFVQPLPPLPDADFSLNFEDIFV